MAITSQAEALLEALSKSLEVPESRYEAADRSYQAIAEWMRRPNSEFFDFDVSVYTQGSFRLGTAIRPASDAEDYDLDIVCEVSERKGQTTQKALHDAMGRETRSYARSKGMEPPEEWDRVWTLNYADGAQFHIDLLPSLPDGAQQRILLESGGFQYDRALTAIAITDRTHPFYTLTTESWPTSNPNGYASWFYERMAPVFRARREAIRVAEAKVDVADIPTYRVKTPLQVAVQILKRHRDLRFRDEPENRPSSIILTTLAAHAYNQETTISGALFSILERMDNHIEKRGEVHWIANPSDPRENFADSWNGEPHKSRAFFDWLETARSDFTAAARSSDYWEIVEALAPRMGRRLVEDALDQVSPRTGITASAASIFRRFLDAPHRKNPSWPTLQLGNVRIASVTADPKGFRAQEYPSDGPALPKETTLRFHAQTDLAKPYRVYWQIVNTGRQAAEARQLRGGFDEDSVARGKLTREETTRYNGSHSVEAFIVKDGYLVARSGLFIVNVM